MHIKNNDGLKVHSAITHYNEIIMNAFRTQSVRLLCPIRGYAGTSWVVMPILFQTLIVIMASINCAKYSGPKNCAARA